MARTWLLFLLLVLPALADPASLRGVVLDRDGRPLAGARVTLRTPDGGCRIVPGHSFRTAITAAGGTFRFDAPPTAMELQVEHKDHATCYAAAERGATVRLTRGGYVEGTVSAPTRVAVTLGLRPLAAVDTAGEFRLGSIPAGETVTLVARSPRHRPIVRRLTLTDGETRRVDLHLEDGLALAGRVVPARAGVTLRASQGEARESKAVTGPDGRFRLTGLREGEVCVVVLGAGEPRIVRGVAGGAELEVRLDR